MTPPARCHLSNTAVPSPFVDSRTPDRADCYACGRSVVVRDGRYAEHNGRIKRRTVASYVFTYIDLDDPVRSIGRVSFQRELLGDVDVITTRTLLGDEASEARAGHRDLIEAMLAHHLDRVPNEEMIDLADALFWRDDRVKVDVLEQALADGFPQALFDDRPGGTT